MIIYLTVVRLAKAIAAGIGRLWRAGIQKRFVEICPALRRVQY